MANTWGGGVLGRKQLTFVHAVLEVLEVLQLLVRGRLAIQLGHFVAQLGPDLGMLSQHEEHVTQETGGGVATGEQHVHELVQDARLVRRTLCQLVRKHVLAGFLVAGPGGLLFVLSGLHGLIYETLGKFSTNAVALGLFLVSVYVIQRSQHATKRDALDGVGKCRCEAELGCAHLEAVDGLSEEELGGGVDGVLEENVLQVHHGLAVAGDQRKETGHQILKSLQIGDLFAIEVGPDQGSRCLPVVAVGIEDALAKQGAEGLQAVADAKFLELEGKDGLDVFRLNGDDGGGEQASRGEGGGAALLEA